MWLTSRFKPAIWLFFGRWLERKGLNALARSCYRNGMSEQGRHGADAAVRLSQLLLAEGRNKDAARHCQQAVRIFPANARLWCALGAANRRLAKMDEARQAYEKALGLDADYAQAWNNLGEWWLVRGDHVEALRHFERALQIEPYLLQAINNRIALLYELGKFREAEAAAREAINQFPQQAELHVNLGNILFHSGKARRAVESFRKALECDPTSPEAQWGLATLLGQTHRLADTIQHLEHEIAVKGESAQRLVSLAHAHHAKGDWQAAEILSNKVLNLQPNNVAALETLARCMSARGDHRRAMEFSRRALEENPDMPAIFSNVAFDATHDPDLTLTEVFAIHEEWSRRYEESIHRCFDFSNREKDSDKVLRIGYVSGDLHMHPVGFLLKDVIRHHDRQQMKVYCYSMNRADDAVTAEIRAAADEWIDAYFISDEALAKLIEQHQIDILVDLSGHTGFNRLPVFARKPAPVQATWIGYFHSTGLKSIDYFITDPYTTPENSGQLFSETPAFLPHTRFLFTPPPYAPDVVEAPVASKGRIAFGCFNRVEKLVDPVILAWSEILKAVPESILILKSAGFEHEETCMQMRLRFQKHGINGDRIQLRPRSTHQEMLAECADLDIALDPFPFNGGMTTLETLWMGIPVVALEGESIVSRQSTSVLCNIGLKELVFRDCESYVAGAIALARDPERIARLRLEMRDRMLASPLCQPEKFAVDLDALYRKMWANWCKGANSTNISAENTASRANIVVKLLNNTTRERKIRLVCGTRASREGFFTSTALGRTFMLQRENLPNLELHLFAENSAGLSAIYNEAIEFARHDPATLVFIHDDVAIVDFFWTERLGTALQAFDIVGVAGNKRRVAGQPAWIFVDEDFTRDSNENLSGIVGHGKRRPCDAIDNYGPSNIECKLLDGLMLAADSEKLIENGLIFDPIFDFHFYDMDFCRQAELKGLRMGTAPISVIHESTGAFGNDAWRNAYRRYIGKYGE